MAATRASQSLFISRATDTPPQRQQHHPVPLVLLHRGVLPPCSCLNSSGGGGGSGGVSSSSDNTNSVSSSSAVSSSSSPKRPNMLEEGFTAMAKVLMGIEPLDDSVIAECASTPAKDSMNQTVNRILGALPFSVDEADRFSFSIRASFHPLYRLLVSSIVTGYTLRRAEYRMCLTKNLDLIQYEEAAKATLATVDEEATTSAGRLREGSDQNQGHSLEIGPPENLSPKASDYVQRLQLQLANTKEELDAQKQEIDRIESSRGNRNVLVEYVQSLGPATVTNMSRPSSPEVVDMIHHLATNTLRKISNDKTTSNFVGNTTVANREGKHDEGTDVACDSIATSRGDLARLLLWCMLMGHHLRGLEDRLHLNSVLEWL